MDESDRKFSAFTKEDCRKLQVIQNKVLRLKIKTGIYEMNTPTSILLDAAQDLSVHQQGALHTVLLVFKLVTRKKPAYLARKFRLKLADAEHIFPNRQENTIQVKSSKLSISRSGFVYRGGKIWNQLPKSLRSEKKLSVFKRLVKKWVTENIPKKPP